jgi:transcription-repair coupling factor (superfamily II helicase)
VESVTERLSLYTRLDNCEDERALRQFYEELNDRFGPVPKQVEDLFDTIRARKAAVEMGFEKMILKEDTLRCYFINRPDSNYFESATFNNILDYLQKQTNKARLKQVGKMFMLIADGINSMQELLEFLQRMNHSVKQKITGIL